jgi:hypothetical protein
MPAAYRSTTASTHDGIKQFCDSEGLRRSVPHERRFISPTGRDGRRRTSALVSGGAYLRGAAAVSRQPETTESHMSTFQTMEQVINPGFASQ